MQYSQRNTGYTYTLFSFYIFNIYEKGIVVWTFIFCVFMYLVLHSFVVQEMSFSKNKYIFNCDVYLCIVQGPKKSKQFPIKIAEITLIEVVENENRKKKKHEAIT